MTESEYVVKTLAAAGEILDVSPERIRQLIREGKLQAHILPTSRTAQGRAYHKWSISMESIETYQRSRKQTGWHYYKITQGQVEE